MSVSVTVDSNAHESTFATMLESVGLSVTRQPLKTGDILVHGNGRSFLIERKRIADFLTNHTAASHENSRWTAERSRLAGEAAAAPTLTSIVLLHGARPKLDEQRYGYGGGLSGIDFFSSLQHTSFNYGCHVVHLPDEEQAAAWVALLVRNLERGKLEEGNAVVDIDAAPPGLTRKRARDSTPQELVGGMLSALPGMSKKKANAVISVYPSLGDLCDVSSKELSDVDCGGRRLGKALAERVKSLF